MVMVVVMRMFVAVAMGMSRLQPAFASTERIAERTVSHVRARRARALAFDMVVVALLHRADLGARTALWLTGETGAGDAALARCRGLTIPMAGAVESLNVAVAGSLLMFEYRRRFGT